MRSSRTTRPTPSRRSSIGSSPRPASASGGAGTGSTWPAMPSRAARRISAIPRPGAIATGRSPHSTPTSPTTGSSASRSPATSSPPADDRERAEQIIATGFLALGSKAHDAENRGQFVLDVVDEQIEATTRAFLGLTVALRPLPRPQDGPDPPARLLRALRHLPKHADLLGHARGRLPEFQRLAPDRASAGRERPRGGPRRSRPSRGPRWRIASPPLVRERDAIPPGEANRDRLRRATSMLATLRHRLLMDRPGGTPRAFAMGVRERDEPVDSPLYVRGELDQPGEVVPRGLVRVLCDDTSASIASGSGRRELADWLASPSNPLTARVIVNRVWLHLFGRGLVPTPDNFGAAGQRGRATRSSSTRWPSSS